MAILMRNIGEIWRCANLFRTEEYEGLGIGSYQDSYIADVCANPGATQEQLSRIMYVHKSNVARQMGSLEEKGFIERRADPADRRSLRVYPTKKAYAAKKAAHALKLAYIELMLLRFRKQTQP